MPALPLAALEKKTEKEHGESQGIVEEQGRQHLPTQGGHMCGPEGCCLPPQGSPTGPGGSVL